MQFRFSELPGQYHANHFLYEIGRSKRKIEILQSLSKEEVMLSENNKLYASMPKDEFTVKDLEDMRDTLMFKEDELELSGLGLNLKS